MCSNGKKSIRECRLSRNGAECLLDVLYNVIDALQTHGDSNYPTILEPAALSLLPASSKYACSAPKSSRTVLIDDNP